MTAIDQILKIGDELKAVKEGDHQDLAGQLLEWVKGNGLELLRPLLEHDLRKMSKQIEVPVYRIDDLTKVLYYPMYELNTFGELRQHIAEHEHLPTDIRLLGVKPDVYFEDERIGGSSFDIEDYTRTLGPYERYIVYPANKGSSFSKLPNTIAVSIVQTPDEEVETVQIRTNAESTVLDVKKQIWFTELLPLTEQICTLLEDEDVVFDDSVKLSTLEGKELAIRIKRHVYDVEGAEGRIGTVSVSVLDSGEDVLRYITEMAQLDNPRLFLGLPNDPQRLDVTDINELIYETLPQPGVKPLYVEEGPDDE